MPLCLSLAFRLLLPDRDYTTGAVVLFISLIIEIIKLVHELLQHIKKLFVIILTSLLNRVIILFQEFNNFKIK